MSETNTTASRASGTLLILGLWLAIAIAIVIRTATNLEITPLMTDTDDALRLVTVRDFLGGQGWYDLVQHRLNTPFGASIHWSRLVDLPIAGLILILRPLAGVHAETLAAYIWPLALLLVLMVLSAKLAMRLAGREALLPGLVLPVLSATLLPEFSPGRFDHHNIQILLSIAIVLAAITAWKKPGAGLVAGVLVATSIAVGTETLPIVAAALVTFGLYWVADQGKATTLRFFGVAFALAGMVHLGIALPPEQWMVPACDAHSIVYALAALATGVAFAILPFLPTTPANWLLRLGAGVVAGSAILALLLLVFPQCLGGPYAALDPWLQANWIANIAEARPLWVSLIKIPGITIAIALPPLVALVVIGWITWRGEDENRTEWLVLGLFLLLTVLVMIFQVRGARLAAPLAIPAGAWLIAAARARYLADQRLPRVAALIGAWLVFAGFAIAVPITWLQNLSSPAPAVTSTNTATNTLGGESLCQQPAAFSKLAEQSARRIMAPVDLGPYLLAFTPNQVVGAPYHRNKDGLLDTVRFFNQPIAEARQIIEARGIEQVVTCMPLPEMRGYPDAAEDSFLRLMQRGELPDWLENTTPGDDGLQIYDVKLN